MNNDKEKQIEEMAVSLSCDVSCSVRKCESCYLYKDGNCLWVSKAKHLFNLGYRKVEESEK